ncbi:hypothetical protein [Hwanghaeella sp.]|uniref:hypothetical protein n=1 Tax=Hwanghaeella sp. TaxID=2605943 RepID=UPI003CCB8C17
MGEYERQQAVHRELRDGDFGPQKSLFRMNDDQVTRFIRAYGIATVAVFGTLGGLAVLSIASLA